MTHGNTISIIISIHKYKRIFCYRAHPAASKEEIPRKWRTPNPSPSLWFPFIAVFSILVFLNLLFCQCEFQCLWCFVSAISSLSVAAFHVWQLQLSLMLFVYLFMPCRIFIIIKEYYSKKIFYILLYNLRLFLNFIGLYAS